MTFREDKAIALAGLFLYLSGESQNCLTLNKLMYLAERESLFQICSPITGDNVVCAEHGPLMKQWFDLLRLQSNQESPIFIITEEQCVIIKEKVDFNRCLSPFEMSVAKNIWRKYGHLTQWSNLEWIAETFPEWRPELPQAPIEHAHIFHAQGLAEFEMRARTRLEKGLDTFSTLLTQPVVTV